MKKTEWISVNKRKPRADRLVLCCHNKDKWVVAGQIDEEGLWYNQFQDRYSDCNITVTHWMPLPKPFNLK